MATSISKVIAYGVISPPNGANIAKAVAYAVLSTEITVGISKAVAYAVLAPPEPVAGSGGKPFINLFF